MSRPAGSGCTATGYPTPDLQQDIIGADGRLIGQVDFLWKAQRTVGEFDGKIK